MPLPFVRTHAYPRHFTPSRRRSCPWGCRDAVVSVERNTYVPQRVAGPFAFKKYRAMSKSKT
jgi:hypothetical protein